MRLKTRSTMFRPLYASPSQSHGAARFPLGGAAGGRVGSPSCARSMDGCAPMNAPGAAIGRRPWAASCPAPKLGWVSTTVLPPSDAT